jgi:hypothetical protein
LLAQDQQDSLLRSINFKLNVFGITPSCSSGGTHVAVVGAGPAGFYAAQHIAKESVELVPEIIPLIESRVADPGFRILILFLTVREKMCTFSTKK